MPRETSNTAPSLNLTMPPSPSEFLSAVQITSLSSNNKPANNNLSINICLAHRHSNRAFMLLSTKLHLLTQIAKSIISLRCLTTINSQMPQAKDPRNSSNLAKPIITKWLQIIKIKENLRVFWRIKLFLIVGSSFSLISSNN